MGKRARKGEGRLFIRTKSKAEHPPGTTGTGGCYWLTYRKDGKRYTVKLRDDAGEAITTLTKAEKARRKIVREVILATDEERLTRLLAVREQTRAEQSPAIEDVWDAFLNCNDAPEAGASTINHYKGRWKAFAEWTTVERLSEVTPKIADKYALHLKRQGHSPNTFNKHIGLLKQLFKALIGTDPFEKVKKQRLKTQSRRELTIAELRKIIDDASGELKTLLLIGGATGLRLGDCCTLKWNDIDFDRRQIRRIPNKLRHNDSAKPVKIGLPNELLQRLLETPARTRRGFVLDGFADRYSKDQPAISNEVQAHFTGCGIQTQKDGTGKTTEYTEALAHWKADGCKGKKPTYTRAVVEVGFHSLRHTFVSLMAERGVPQSTVQAIVGHGSPVMTMHYTHVTDKAAEQATLRIGTGEEDAEFKELPDPIPQWAIERIERMNSKNWKQTKEQLLEATR